MEIIPWNDLESSWRWEVLELFSSLWAEQHSHLQVLQGEPYLVLALQESAAHID